MITAEKQGTSTIFFDHSLEDGFSHREIDKLMETLPGRPSRLMVFSQDKIWSLHGETLTQLLQNQDVAWELFLLEDGEACKTLTCFGSALEHMVSSGFDRSSAILAFGGGTVGDLSGFVAASFMRGIPWIYIPTTLLSVQDASVGGKVGINLKNGKNLAGAFWAPNGVFISTHYLGTLPDREFHAGSMELIKHGILSGNDLYRQVLEFPANIGRDLANWETMLFQGVRTKMKVVDEDFHEKGPRKNLNLGHTLAHAIETTSNYAIHHGEAVGLGLIFATILSNHLGYDYHWDPLHTWILERLPMNEIRHELVDADHILSLTTFDKKRAAGKTQWVIPIQPGNMEWRHDLDEAVLTSALKNWEETIR